MARLRSTLPYDPRTDRIADASWLGAVGRSAIEWFVANGYAPAYGKVTS